MVIPEEIGDHVLPQNQIAESVHGAQKYSQIGPDAAEKLLRSAVESSQLFIMMRVEYEIQISLLAMLNLVAFF